MWRDDLPAVASWRLRCAPEDARALHPEDVPPVTYVSEDAVGSRRELCIGAGAHTHYWDDSAKAIAMELDSIIERAIFLPRYPVSAARRFAVEVNG